ncbi:MAG: alpha/beta hydrolase family protein [Desulfomonilia bacterium]
MRSREFQLTHQGTSIRVWHYCPETPRRGLTPAVVFCHGIPGSRPNPDDRGYLPLVEEITSDGYFCIVFNFRGCGLSSGNIDMRGWQRDLAMVVENIYDTPKIDPASIHCIGFSAGGAIAVHYASYEKRIASLMLMATPCRFADVLPDDPALMADHFRQLGTIRDPEYPPDLRGWHKEFLALNPEQHIPFLSPRSVHIVHGDSDETVPVNHAQILYDAANLPKKITILNGAGHQLRKDERSLEIIRSWLREVA